MPVLNRLKHAWNAFLNMSTRETTHTRHSYSSYGTRPDRVRLRSTNERTIISSIYTRVAIDVAAVSIKHVRLDDQERFEDVIKSGLNNCLTVEANIDQAATAFRQDFVMTLFDKGVASMAPIDATQNPEFFGSFDIQTMRVAEIVDWHPEHVKLDIYNEKTGRRENVDLGKRFQAIVENPLYNIMNEPNSTLQRLLRKLHLLDAVDEQTSSGKLDMIIQLPYQIKSESRREQASQRRQDIEFQLKGSQYGIAYIDGTEKITQLNRPSENNLLAQITYLTELLYSQLGITKTVMDGTASEAEMKNYHARTVNPILVAIVEAMRRSFLTKTARSQGQSIMFFRDIFGMISTEHLGDFADKMTRSEALTSNEIRAIVGVKPSKDKKADELRNTNMPLDKSLGADEKKPLALNAPPPE